MILQCVLYTRLMRYLRLVLSCVASLLSLIAWVGARHIGMKELTVYDIFPLFGLIAFTLMWAEIVTTAVATFRGISIKPNARIEAAASGFILSLIILHPLALWIGLFIDGAGIPPASYLSVYGVNGLAIMALVFGTVSLCIFLSYELHRWFSQKTWWKYIAWLQSVALALIFVHAFVLGQEAGHSWFRVIWVIYGITLVVAIIYNSHKQKGEKS